MTVVACLLFCWIEKEWKSYNVEPGRIILVFDNERMNVHQRLHYVMGRREESGKQRESDSWLSFFIIFINEKKKRMSKNGFVWAIRQQSSTKIKKYLLRNDTRDWIELPIVFNFIICHFQLIPGSSFPMYSITGSFF
jgi:hypothetical protein